MKLGFGWGDDLKFMISPEYRYYESCQDSLEGGSGKNISTNEHNLRGRSELGSLTRLASVSCACCPGWLHMYTTLHQNPWKKKGSDPSWKCQRKRRRTNETWARGRGGACIGTITKSKNKRGTDAVPLYILCRILTVFHMQSAHIRLFTIFKTYLFSLLGLENAHGRSAAKKKLLLKTYLFLYLRLLIWYIS